MNADMTRYDYSIIGGGIIGLTIAYELLIQHPTASVCILEKESDIAHHASGRNSGILHAGFYYTADSLKAALTVSGNQLMKQFCKKHGIFVRESGKLVVTQSTKELKTLHVLYERGKQNGAPVHLINEHDAKAIEPTANTVQQALYSPSTAAVDPNAVCQHVKACILAKGGHIYTHTKVTAITPTTIVTSQGTFQYNHMINCAGIYADRIAQLCGIGHDYTMVPFKGLYLKYNGTQSLNTNIYPVPNILNPFLGVHFTKTAQGTIKIGPTAIPAFWREHYNGLDNFKLHECATILALEMRLLFRNQAQFRTIAQHEFPKYWRPYLIQEALKLARFDRHHFKPMPSGIRAQLFNKKTNAFEMDFIIQHTPTSTHMLNAVSPAFTCAFSIAKHMVATINKRAVSKYIQ